MKKLVSILVPIYGVEKYIERCATSLFEQTYPYCEFIFVNDCTKDNSVNILKKVIKRYTSLENQIKIIEHKENQGLGGARLTGLQAAKGEYISFVDSDDYVERRYIEKMIKVAENTNAELIISTEINLKEEEKQLSASQLLKACLCRQRTCRIWGQLLKKNIFIENNIYPIQGIDHAEDFHVMCKYISCCNNIWGIKEKLYHYTTDNENSYTKNYTDKSLLSIYKAIQSSSKYLLDKNYNQYHKIVLLSNLYFTRWIFENTENKIYQYKFSQFVKKSYFPLWGKLLLLAIKSKCKLINRILFKTAYTIIKMG